MPRKSEFYICSNCGHTANRELGKCPSCQKFGTMVLDVQRSESSVSNSKSVGTKTVSSISTPRSPARLITDIKAEELVRQSTGITELDRVLGGGIVKGSVILLAGEPGVGKALAVDTPIPTEKGWSEMGALSVGDVIFDELGEKTEVVAVSPVWENRPVYEMKFSDGSVITADTNHEWVVSYTTQGHKVTAILTTGEIFSMKNAYYSFEVGGVPAVDIEGAPRPTPKTPRTIVSITKASSVPVRCIQVSGASSLFLAGHGLVPTHNSSILALVAHQASLKEKVLYVSGEESEHQIALRHQRMNATGNHLYLASENDLTKIQGHIEEVNPQLIIVDSLQTIASPDVDGTAGSPSQVKEVATVLTRLAKEKNVPLVFVGHFTKDAQIAGPRVVEHLVDVVLTFEGQDDSTLRMLRGVKNRLGPADEIGCFEHTESGLEEVPDPSGLLLDSRQDTVSGVATSIFLEGKRALPVEIQALVTPTMLPNPRKVTSGLDYARTVMMQAVIQKHAKVRVADKDVYISTIGNIKVKEPAVDLATVMALIAANKNLTSRNDAVSIGEVTLSGRIKKVPGMQRRLTEAERLGFSAAYVPKGTRDMVKSSSLNIIEVQNVLNAANFVEFYSQSAGDE